MKDINGELRSAVHAQNLRAVAAFLASPELTGEAREVVHAYVAAAGVAARLLVAFFGRQPAVLAEVVGRDEAHAAQGAALRAKILASLDRFEVYFLTKPKWARIPQAEHERELICYAQALSELRSKIEATTDAATFNVSSELAIGPEQPENLGFASVGLLKPTSWGYYATTLHERVRELK